MRVGVAAVGVLGPGLGGWQHARTVLDGTKPYVHAATVFTPIACVPAAERRRLGVPIKLALEAGLEAFRNAGRDPRMTRTVFTSSGGDGENVHAICSTLASTDRALSPTRFHNAVHNAAAGYWSITTGAQAPSTSVCAHDASFAAGLLEAASQVTVDRVPVALIAYDHGYPEPLHAVRPIAGDFAVALVLLPAAEASALGVLEIDLVRDVTGGVRGGVPATGPMSDPALEALRSGIPAARALTLLAALARGTADIVTLDYLDAMRVRVRVVPAEKRMAISPSSGQSALPTTPTGT